jgi:hypothetical protein
MPRHNPHLPFFAGRDMRGLPPPAREHRVCVSLDLSTGVRRTYTVHVRARGACHAHALALAEAERIASTSPLAGRILAGGAL